MSGKRWSVVERLLVVVILAELVAIGISRAGRDGPSSAGIEVPLPRLELIDPLSASELRVARDSLQAAVDDGRGSGAEWGALADAYLAFGFFDAAEFCYDRGLVASPASYKLNHRLGLCLDSMGRTDDAIVSLQRAARVGSPRQQVETRYHLGQNYLQAERPLKAEAALDIASPHYVGVHFQLAKVLLRTGRAAEAKKYADAMAVEFDAVANLLLLRARIEEALGNAEAARELRDRVAWTPVYMPLDGGFSRFIDETRNRYGAWRGFQQAASLFQDAARRGEAIAKMEASLAAEWQVDPAMQLAIMYHQADRPAEVVDTLELSRQRFGDSPRRAELLGDSYLALGDRQRARAEWERSLRMRPLSSVHKKLVLFLRDTEPELASQQLAQHNYRLGVEHYRAGRLDAASAALQNALQVDPRQADAWFYLGETRRALGDAGGAREAYRGCVDVDPEHSRVHARL